MKSKKLQQFNFFLKKYENSAKINDNINGEKYLRQLLNLEPKNYATLNELGTILSKLGDFSSALKYHLEAAEIEPTNKVILTNVGLDYFKLDDFESSEKFLNHALLIDPNYYEANLILGSLYHAFGKYNELIKVASTALIKWPNKNEIHNLLSAGLIGHNLVDEALFSCQTALILNPESIESKINLALALDLKGKHNEAISIYESLINVKNDINDIFISLIKYNLSYSYLNLGLIEKGWHYYDFGLSDNIPRHMRRRPTRKFLQEMWHGQELKDAVLLVWAEQGLGDEILFMSLIPDLLKIVKNVILECDPRLNKIVARSFPSIIVRQPTFDTYGNQTRDDYLYHVPIGSLNKFLRTNVNDYYKNNRPYLIPPIKSIFKYHDFIEEEKKLGKILIGICWRSGFIDIERSNHYIPLKEWDQIFSMPNVSFINLQYGECEDEIKNVENLYKIVIHRWPDINLKSTVSLTSVFLLRISFNCSK